MFVRLKDRIAFSGAEGGGGGGAGGSGAAGGGSAGSDAGGQPGGAGQGAGAGGAPLAFAETLPEAIRNEAAFRDIRDLPSLATSYLNAQKLLGVPADQIVRLPGQDDTAGWDQVYAKLGRPEKADGYKFADVKLPDGLKVDDTLKTGYMDAAHKAGLSTRQANSLYEWWNGAMASGFTAQQGQTAQGLAQAEAALKTEWGAAFDQNVQLAKDAINHYGGEKLKAELDANGMANSPELARVMAKIGANLREDGALTGRGGGGGDMKSPAEARQEINALQADKDFAKQYATKGAPGHDDAVARMSRLYAMAYPEQG